MTAPAILEARGLAKRFGARTIFSDLSLALGAGEFLTVVGPSGSGKTTLLRIIAGLASPDAGEILIRGAVVSSPGMTAPPWERGLGFVFQDPTLWPHMTVEENIEFGLYALDPEEARRRSAAWLEKTGLEALAKRRPPGLSPGEARRVAILRSLAPAPMLLLLDEPLASLDRANRELIVRLIETPLRAGTTVILVTHHEQETASFGGRTLVLEPGEPPILR